MNEHEESWTEFVIEGGAGTNPAVARDLTGWEAVVFELADEVPDSCGNSGKHCDTMGSHLIETEPG